MQNLLLKTLDSQSKLLFSGKINILLKKNAQFYAVVFFDQGLIVNVHLQNRQGKTALFQLILESYKSSFEDNFDLVIEPELIEKVSKKMQLSYKESLEELEKYLKSKHPPENITLEIPTKDLYKIFEEFFPEKSRFLTAILILLKKNNCLKIKN